MSLTNTVSFLLYRTCSWPSSMTHTRRWRLTCPSRGLRWKWLISLRRYWTTCIKSTPAAVPITTERLRDQSEHLNYFSRSYFKYCNFWVWLYLFRDKKNVIREEYQKMSPPGNVFSLKLDIFHKTEIISSDMSRGSLYFSLSAPKHVI